MTNCRTTFDTAEQPASTRHRRGGGDSDRASIMVLGAAAGAPAQRGAVRVQDAHHARKADYAKMSGRPLRSYVKFGAIMNGAGYRCG
jgi:hypothetical protein